MGLGTRRAQVGSRLWSGLASSLVLMWGWDGSWSQDSRRAPGGHAGGCPFETAQVPGPWVVPTDQGKASRVAGRRASGGSVERLLWPQGPVTTWATKRTL